MELNCPACNKTNVDTACACARCGCELTVLWSIKIAAAQHLGHASAALVRGDPAPALAHATRSWELLQSAAAAATAAAAAASLGDLEMMELWRYRFSRV